MEKYYYTIAEVAEETGIAMSNIRFWEKEIPQLKPHRNERRTRFYTKEDIQLIKNIIFLQQQNLTLDGVRKKLRENNIDDLTRKQQISEKLISIKEELRKMAKSL